MFRGDFVGILILACPSDEEGWVLVMVTSVPLTATAAETSVLPGAAPQPLRMPAAAAAATAAHSRRVLTVVLS